MKKILVLIFLFSFLVAPLTVSAQFGKATAKLDAVAGKTGLTPDFQMSISTIIIGVLSLAGTIFLVLTVYAGILWMTAQGKEEQVTKAKDIIMQAIIGLAITLAAYAITAFVTGKLNPSTPSDKTPVVINTQKNCTDKGNLCHVACDVSEIQVGTCPDNADSPTKSLCCAKK